MSQLYSAQLNNNNNNNIRLIRRCQNTTCYNDMENGQETWNNRSVRLLVAVFIQLAKLVKLKQQNSVHRKV